MPSELAAKQCVPCRGGTAPLAGEALSRLVECVDPDWDVVDGHHLARRFLLADFRQALELTHQIGELAESESHHPDIHLSWGKVEVTIYTHKIDGLTESDFILAAKIDQIALPAAT
jgi:4a-hydroxytetrahydrobiopterin dehydratase